MNRPRNVSVSVVEVGGELRIWTASFTLRGGLPTKDGRHDEKRARVVAKFIEEAIAGLDVGEIP